MKIEQQYYNILWHKQPKDILLAIEQAGRTCYKSEDKITETSATPFVERLIASGHESVLEHQSFSVRFITDRGVTHELVRHRLASFSQESTRYCNYSKDKFGNELTFILPTFLYGYGSDNPSWEHWQKAMEDSEDRYFELLEDGLTPQDARSVLPNSVKTEIVVTANIREWRTILKQRTSKKAHPQMRDLMTPLLFELDTCLTPLFHDIVDLNL